MKIQCDVCKKEEASVFCSADEAALCVGCDHRVHYANKLASKHNRLSLLYPSCKDAPRCDICQERRAFLFCREDRAIFCRECDVSIHTVNEHTKNHNRFLLTGVKLSSCTTTTTASSSTNSFDASLDSKITKKSQSSMEEEMLLSLTPKPHDPPQYGTCVVDQTTVSEGGSTSSISEYLIEMLPGWHVEDLLDSTSAPPHGFCKSNDHLPFLDANLETSLGGLTSEDLTIWVPQAPPPFQPSHPPQIDVQKDGLFKELKEVINPNPTKGWSDHGFMVPQIRHPSNKRSRPHW